MAQAAERTFERRRAIDWCVAGGILFADVRAMLLGRNSMRKNTELKAKSATRIRGRKLAVKKNSLKDLTPRGPAVKGGTMCCRSR